MWRILRRGASPLLNTRLPLAPGLGFAEGYLDSEKRLSLNIKLSDKRYNYVASFIGLIYNNVILKRVVENGKELHG